MNFYKNIVLMKRKVKKKDRTFNKGGFYLRKMQIKTNKNIKIRALPQAQ